MTVFGYMFIVSLLNQNIKLHEFGFCFWPLFPILRTVLGEKQALKQSRCYQCPPLYRLSQTPAVNICNFKSEDAFQKLQKAILPRHQAWRYTTPPPPKSIPQSIILRICCTNITAPLSFSGGGVGVRGWGKDLPPFVTAHCFIGYLPFPVSLSGSPTSSHHSSKYLPSNSCLRVCLERPKPRWQIFVIVEWIIHRGF